MSRPKTGSTTGAAPAAANGTRLAQRATVSQLPERAPAVPRATSTARITRTTTPSGRRSGRSAVVRLGPTGRVPRTRSSSSPKGPRRGWPNGSYPVRRRLAQAVHERAEPLARAGARRGREAAGKPDVDEEEDERDHQAQRKEAGLRPDARPEDGVVPDALEPRGVRYELEADPHQEDRAEQDQRNDAQHQLRAERSDPTPPGAAIVGAARAAASRGRARWRRAMAVADGAWPMERRRRVVRIRRVAVIRMIGCATVVGCARVIGL